MRGAYLAVLAFAFVFSFGPARADIAPPYPEFTTGVDISEGEPYPKVTAVAKNSPAEKAGVRPGDAVLALNGAYGKTRAPFYFWLKGLRGPKNSTLRLIVLRADSEVVVFDMPRTIAAR
jgi:C-terminal processing protease CtpA/Prc